MMPCFLVKGNGSPRRVMLTAHRHPFDHRLTAHWGDDGYRPVPPFPQPFDVAASARLLRIPPQSPSSECQPCPGFPGQGAPPAPPGPRRSGSAACPSRARGGPARSAQRCLGTRLRCCNYGVKVFPLLPPTARIPEAGPGVWLPGSRGPGGRLPRELARLKPLIPSPRRPSSKFRLLPRVIGEMREVFATRIALGTRVCSRGCARVCARVWGPLLCLGASWAPCVCGRPSELTKAQGVWGTCSYRWHRCLCVPGGCMRVHGHVSVDPSVRVCGGRSLRSQYARAWARASTCVHSLDSRACSRSQPVLTKFSP